MPTATSAALRQTVVAGWYWRLKRNPSTVRNHWLTKTRYFRAVDEVLTAGPARALTWRTITAVARPRGCRSTFYEVTGRNARHPMIDDLIRDGRCDSIQIALSYRREDPVDQLVDETKVWSFWPYRERLLAGLAYVTTPERAAAALEVALADWARANQPLAAALGHTPPACAVEDLMVLADGRIAALRAAHRLAGVLREVLEAA